MVSPGVKLPVAILHVEERVLFSMACEECLVACGECFIDYVQLPGSNYWRFFKLCEYYDFFNLVVLIYSQIYSSYTTGLSGGSPLCPIGSYYGYVCTKL